MISEYMFTAPQPFGCHKRKGKRIAEGNKSMTGERTFHYSQGVSFREYSGDHKWKRDVETLSNSKSGTARAKRSEGKVTTVDHLFSMSSETTKGPGVLNDGQY